MCILFLLTFVLQDGFANKFLLPTFDSVEARKILLELLADGKLSKRNISLEYTQSNYGLDFKISSVVDGKGTFVVLSPEQFPVIDNDKFPFPSRYSWSFQFDSNDQIVEIRCYIQKNVYLVARPYYSSTEFSLFLENQYIYENIGIPISIKSFIQMPFEEFLHITQSSLYWDWVLSTDVLTLINARSINYANYLEINLNKELQARIFDSSILTNSEYVYEDNDIAEKNIERETDYVIKNINALLDYIKSGRIDKSQFTPYYPSGQAIALYDLKYPKMFIKNIKTFLDFYPDFYTSTEQLTPPFYRDLKNQLSTLYSELYFMTTKYPGLWYLVPVIEEERVGELISKRYVALEILIPYFMPNGEFVLYGYDNLRKFITDEKVNSKQKNYYYEISIFRVPNKRLNTLE